MRETSSTDPPPDGFADRRRYPHDVRLTIVASLAAVAAIVATGPAVAADRSITDGAGNRIRISLEAPDARAPAIGAILRRAAHGPEINRVRIRAVPAASIARLCSSAAARACYQGASDGSGEIIVPATGTGLEHALLHEYGHHIDNSFRHGAAAEPNGTLRWWRARRMGARVRAGEVAGDYSKGWPRSIGEIFAEDYVQLNLRSSFGIPWLTAPSTSVLRALRRDITGSATGAAPRTPSDEGGGAPDVGAAPTRLANGGGGALDPAQTRDLAFGLLGPQRGVELTVRVANPAATAIAAVTVTCDGVIIGQAAATQTAPAVVTRDGLGPAQCTAQIQNTGDGALAYEFSLVLSRPAS
jgi:hypothetical protein